MPELTRLTRRGGLTIPARLRAEVGLKEKDKVLVETKPDRSISVKPVDTFDLEKLYGAVDSRGIGVDEAIEKAKSTWAADISHE